MSRGPLTLGTYGAVTAKQQSNGKWRATTRYRDFDGATRPVQAFGDTKNKAIARLRDNIQNRDGARSQDKLISRETRLTDLADLWLAELELDENIDPQTIAGYRKEIKVSTDKRADPKTVKIKSPKVGIGDLMVWEATTSRLDLYLKSIIAAGHKRKARIHKVILTGMLGLAVRHDAIPVNPVPGVARVRRKKSQPRTIEREALHALRAQLRIWATGHEIPGTPAHKSGPSRDQNIPRIADILLGTGTRPGEALALRRCDIDITTTPWRATICGTIVRVDSKLFRQPWTKTAAGYRTVHLPGFAVRALEELGADDWKADDETLVFPNRKGNPRELQNFGRIWRQARGTTFAWVTPATFRKVVATIIAEEVDADQAGRQLGHVPGSNVTELHYIDRPSLAPDSSPILDRLVG